MQIVVTAFLDESMVLLRDSTRLVDLYQERHADFVPELLQWLRQGERLLEKYRRGQLGAMSALRGKALAAQAGVHEGADPATRRLQARKQMAGACVLILSQAQALLNEVHASLEARKDEASRLIQQMLQILIQSGSLPAILSVPRPPAERLSHIWQTCQTRPEISTGARQVLGLVAWADALRIIDETLDSWRL